MPPVNVPRGYARPFYASVKICLAEIHAAF